MHKGSYFFCKEIQNRTDFCTAVLQMYDKLKEKQRQKCF